MDITTIRQEFNSNIGQISIFIDTLIKIENGTIVGITSDAFKIMKASVFLQMYNIMEANTHKVISLIHKTINNDNLDFDNLTEHMQKIWFKHLKHIINTPDLHGTFTLIKDNHANVNFIDFDRDIYEKHIIKISGNVDKKSIRELCNNMAITIDDTQLSDKLRDIKDKRNELAHGNVTFNDLGRDIVPSSLVVLLEEVKLSCNHFFDSIDDFCTNKKYKV